MLREQDVQTLDEALRYVSGVTTEMRDGTATRYDLFSIRGFDADTYFNGLKLLSNGEYAAPQVDPYLLGRVDVLKGPVSVLYGQAQAGRQAGGPDQQAADRDAAARGRRRVREFLMPSNGRSVGHLVMQV